MSVFTRKAVPTNLTPTRRTTRLAASKVQLLTGPAIGEALTDLCKTGPAFVAVPFVSVGAVRLLPLARGSVLVACINEPSARAGHVSPKDLVAMRRRGVQLFDNPKLHAKVYVFPRAAVIGSSNVSRTSRNDLEEACVLSHDPSLVRQARELVQSLAIGSPLPEQYVSGLPQREPARYPSVRSERSRATPRDAEKALFVASTVEGDYSEDEERVAVRARDEAKKRAVRRLDFYTLLWPRDPGIRVGDEILVREDDDARDVRIQPPGVVFSIKRRSSGAVMVAYAVDPGQRDRTKKRFREVVPKGAAKHILGPKNTFRKVPNAVREDLLSPWKPWRAPLRGANRS
jgi:hypothetical protein